MAAGVTGNNIPAGGTSISQGILHDVRIKTRYNDLIVLTPQVVVTLCRC